LGLGKRKVERECIEISALGLEDIIVDIEAVRSGGTDATMKLLSMGPGGHEEVIFRVIETSLRKKILR